MQAIKHLMFFFILKTNCDENAGTKYSHFIPEDLKTLCPYTPFCGKNASLPFLDIHKFVPCCRDCSCDRLCGLRSNCCFKYLDLYNIEETYRMICRSTISTDLRSKDFKEKEFGRILHLRMINVCLDVYTSPLIIKEEVDINLFQPVYSEKNGFVYFNDVIAKCNNINSTVPFRKTITCVIKGEFSTDDDLIIQDLKPNEHCIAKFIPPAGANLKSEQCEPDVIRKCESNSNLSEKDLSMLQTLCESFNATYVVQTSWKTYFYGNIYCYKCSGLLHDETLNQYEHNCDVSIFDATIELTKLHPQHRSLTIFLIPGILESSKTKKNIEGPSAECPINQVHVHSFVKTCRPVICPNYKIRIQNKCRFYSRKMEGGPFVVLLQLTPVDKNTKILLSFLDELSESDRRDKTAEWIKRKTLQKWTFFVYQHSYKNSSYIDYFVVKAVFTFSSANPGFIAKQVKAAMGDTWYIVQNNVTVAMETEFNRYTSYIEGIMSLEEIIFSPKCKEPIEPHFIDQLKYVYVPSNLKIIKNSTLTCMSKKNLSLFDVRDKFMYKISMFSSLPFISEIVITKLFYCQQVDLFPEEYEFNGDSIFFKVRNVTLYSFRQVNSLAGNQVTVNGTKKTVRICLNEFQNSLNVAKEALDSYRNIMLFFLIIKVALKLTRMGFI